MAGAFGKFEKGVENAVASAFRAFRSELKPVEILTEMKKSMDRDVARLSRDRSVSPNDFAVYLSPEDFARVENWGREALSEEFAQELTNHAAEQDYIFVGPITIDFAVDSSVREGTVEVETRATRGAVAPATTSAANASNPMIQIGKDRYILTGPTTVIGRGSDCDITIDDAGISRHHLELQITPNGVIATDLGSTNGTYVEGHRVPAATLVDGNTITIGRTHIMFWTGEGARS